ncbi:MAG TPA: DUF1559 domain-containing protein [Gemmataceae bacterium]|nr:DUF1559 domain-containing protein [Gemmataceae bacterium]
MRSTSRYNRDRRPGFTLIELLVVLAIIAVLIGLLLPAVQQVRGAAERAQCLNNLKQLALALHQYHGDYKSFPPGHRSLRNADQLPYSGWTLSILPYLDHRQLYDRSRAAYRVSSSPFRNPPHTGLSSPVQVFACPADGRVPGPQTSQQSGEVVALTSYLGVSGKDYATQDGVLGQDSRLRFADIRDGSSNTLLLGERPPSADLQFGWWYAGVGQGGTGSADLVLGVREQNLQVFTVGSPCGPGFYPFAPATFNDPCGMFHFWSPHSSGANFAFADGSARFLDYSANPLLPALASRAGGEAATLPE